MLLNSVQKQIIHVCPDLSTGIFKNIPLMTDIIRQSQVQHNTGR